MTQSYNVQDAVDHFKKEEWCAELLDAPGIFHFLPMSRMPDGGGKAAQGGQSRDKLFAKMLNNDDSVPWMVAFAQDPSRAPLPKPPADTPDATTLLIPFVTLIFDLKEGVDGFNGFTHGGFTACMIDEVMGALFLINYGYQLQMHAEARRAAKKDTTGKTPSEWTVPPGIHDMIANARVLTASMDIKLRKPILTPSVVAATASIAKIDGRKLFVDVVVKDRKGSVCASCEGLWMVIQQGGAKI